LLSITKASSLGRQNAGRRRRIRVWPQEQFGIQHILRFAKNATEPGFVLILEFPNTTNLIFADVEGQPLLSKERPQSKASEIRDFGERDFIYSTNNSMTRI